MKLIVTILILLIVDYYFYSAIATILNNYIVKIIYWLISFSFYFAILYILLNYYDQDYTVESGNNLIICTSLILIIFVSKFLGIVPLIIDDIIRSFKLLNIFLFKIDTPYNVDRLKFLKHTAVIISSFLFSTMLLGMTFGRYNFKKNYQDIFLKKWPKKLNGYKIIHISDLHLGSFGSIEKLEEVVKIINEEVADLIVFTGDLVNNSFHEATPYISTLKKLIAKDGKFSVLGNHDYGDYMGIKRDTKEWAENFQNLKNLEKDAGFQLLLNEAITINRSADKFNLIGVENWGAGNFNKDGDIDSAIKNIDQSLPNILLSHDPSHWRQVILKKNYNIDLQLSGHTHGMQFGVDIPGVKWSPVQYRYKQWAGLYRKDQKQIYVNRGLGSLGYAGRVGIMPDISILNIRSV